MNRQESIKSEPNSKRLCRNLKIGLAVLALCEGLLASHHLAFYFLYVKHFEVDLLSYSVFETIIGMLFYLNPIIGYFSDRVSLFGSKKKSYLILTGLITTISYFLCAGSTRWDMPVCLLFLLNLIIEIMISFRTVLIDSFCVIVHNIQKMVIEENASSSTSSVSALFCCRLVGKVLSTILMAVFYDHLGINCKLISLLHPRRSGSSWNSCCLLSDRAYSSW